MSALPVAEGCVVTRMLGGISEAAAKQLCFVIGAIVAQIMLWCIEYHPIEIIFALNRMNRLGSA